jgi:hypothetical protein
MDAHSLGHDKDFRNRNLAGPGPAEPFHRAKNRHSPLDIWEWVEEEQVATPERIPKQGNLLQGGENSIESANRRIQYQQLHHVPRTWR